MSLDPGPSAEQIDKALRDEPDSTLEWLAAQHTPEAARRHWAALTVDERRAQRATNEQSRRRQLAARQAQTEAEERERERQARAAEERLEQDYKAQLLRAWPGDSRSFEAAWPQLVQEWRLGRMRERLERDEEHARQLAYHRLV